MRDLEIRGAGNLLGESQSGHIAAVGYDLYCQMVTEAVGEMKGQPVKEPSELKLDVPTDAYLPNDYVTKEESRLVNEQNCLTIVGSEVTVKCVQIAGVLARRIVCWKQRGERVKCGEQFGMIKFSSRTDLLMPSNVEVTVSVGMHVKGGETIIGRIKN
jgi:hypothetical protein